MARTKGATGVKYRRSIDLSGTVNENTKPIKALNKKVNNLAKQVSIAKPEKERLAVYSTAVIGQLNGDVASSDGIVAFDVTPYPTQGDQVGQRSGAAIKLMSSHYDFQVGQQTGVEYAIKYRITWVRVIGQPYKTTEIAPQLLDEMFKPTLWINGANIRDLNANYNPDKFGTYKIIKRVTRTLKADTISGLMNTHVFKVGFKYNKGKGHNLRFNQNLTTTNNLYDGQIIMILQADRGNAGSVATPAGVTGVYNTTPLTGLFVQWQKTDYFVDP